MMDPESERCRELRADIEELQRRFAGTPHAEPRADAPDEGAGEPVQGEVERALANQIKQLTVDYERECGG